MPESIFIERVTTALLSAATAAELRGLCDAAYMEPTVPFFESVGPGEHLLGYVGGRLVSHLMWVTRWLQPEGTAPLRTAYVELVATAPAAQRRGYATHLLKALPALLDRYDIAALSPATDHLYTRLGWELWQGSLYARRDGALARSESDRVMILRLAGTPALNLSQSLSVEWRAGEVW